MEIDLIEPKKELDILAQNHLKLFQNFLDGLKPKNSKPEILLMGVLLENEKHLAILEDYVYEKYPRSESVIIAGKGLPSPNSHKQILLLGHVFEIRKKFDNLQRQYLLSVFADNTPS